MHEGPETEFEREYSETIRATAIAFANTDGGTVYIGIEDDGTVCGVADPDETVRRVTDMVRNSIRPDLTPFFRCAIEEREGKPVVSVRIQRGTAVPYYIGAKGIRPEGVYIRRGASSVPAAEGMIRDMIRESSDNHYDGARSIEQELTFERTEEIFRKRGVEFGEAQRRSLGVVLPDGTYSNLALLLSEQCPHSIRVAVYEGTSKGTFRDRKELTGSVLGQMEDAYEYIDRFNLTRAEIGGLERVERRSYPCDAVREALVNALVHRDYGYSGSTLVSIFEDRVELLSLGGLVSGLSYNDLELGVSMLRNRKLSNVFYRLMLIEAYGTGIGRIRETYEGTGMAPKIEVSDHAFKVTLPNLNAPGKLRPIVAGASVAMGEPPAAIRRPPVAMSGLPVAMDEPPMVLSEGPATMAAPKPQPGSRRAILLDLCARKGSLTRRDAEERLGLSMPSAAQLIRDMVLRGLLVKTGDGRHARYVLPNR